jgi:hypothetical protein
VIHLSHDSRVVLNLAVKYILNRDGSIFTGDWLRRMEERFSGVKDLRIPCGLQKISRPSLTKILSAWSMVKDESIKTWYLLGNINEALIQRLGQNLTFLVSVYTPDMPLQMLPSSETLATSFGLGLLEVERKYSGDKSAVPTIDYLAVQSKAVPKTLLGVTRTEVGNLVTFKFGSALSDFSWLLAPRLFYLPVVLLIFYLVLLIFYLVLLVFTTYYYICLGIDSDVLIANLSWTNILLFLRVLIEQFTK